MYCVAHEVDQGLWCVSVECVCADVFGVLLPLEQGLLVQTSTPLQRLRGNGWMESLVLSQLG